LAYRFTIDARNNADHRTRAQREEDEVRKEKHAERHAEDVRDVDVQYIEECARPAEQAYEFTPSREPRRAKQDWQSDEEIGHVGGDERLKQFVRRIDDVLVQESDNGRDGHDEGDGER
jgi:hypothetical protein